MEYRAFGFTMRPMSKYEKGILQVLLNTVEFPGRVEILDQLTTAQVEEIDPDGSLKFVISSHSAASVKGRIPVEAEFVDVDGIRGHVLLHLVNGKISELEFYKDDSSHVLIRHQSKDFKIMTTGF